MDDLFTYHVVGWRGGFLQTGLEVNYFLWEVTREYGLCGCRRDVVYVAKLKHVPCYEFKNTLITRKQIDCEWEVKQRKIIILVGTWWGLINFDVNS